MNGFLSWLSGVARPLLLIVAGLLAVGALLVLFDMTLVGWGLYAIGHLGTLLAVPAIASVARPGSRFDAFGWLTVAVVVIGLLVGLVAVASVASLHAQPSGAPHDLLPFAIAPVGPIGELVTWIGMALFGYAAYRVSSVPPAAAVLFVAAAIVALAGDLNVVSPLAWTGAVLLVSFALVWTATSIPTPGRRSPSETSAVGA